MGRLRCVSESVGRLPAGGDSVRNAPLRTHRRTPDARIGACGSSPRKTPARDCEVRPRRCGSDSAQATDRSRRRRIARLPRARTVGEPVARRAARLDDHVSPNPPTNSSSRRAPARRCRACRWRGAACSRSTLRLRRREQRIGHGEAGMGCGAGLAASSSGRCGRMKLRPPALTKPALVPSSADPFRPDRSHALHPVVAAADRAPVRPLRFHRALHLQAAAGCGQHVVVRLHRLMSKMRNAVASCPLVTAMVLLAKRTRPRLSPLPSPPTRSPRRSPD